MSIVYNQNFESSTVGTSLTDASLNYVVASASLSEVQTNWGTKAAQLSTGGWASAIYDGATFDYTDVSMRCGVDSRSIIIFRSNTGSYIAGGIPDESYLFQVIPNQPNEVRLWNCTGGNIYLVAQTSSSGLDPSNYTCRVLANGSNIDCFINGVKYISVTGATYHPSGKVGFGSYGGTAFYDDITIDDGIFTLPTQISPISVLLPMLSGFYLIQV